MDFNFDDAEKDTDTIVPLDENNLDEAGEELSYFDFCRQEHDRTSGKRQREALRVLNLKSVQSVPK